MFAELLHVQRTLRSKCPVFPLTVAQWPMTSEYYWWTGEFLSYWPTLASGISTIADKWRDRKKNGIGFWKISEYTAMFVLFAILIYSDNYNIYNINTYYKWNAISKNKNMGQWCFIQGSWFFRHWPRCQDGPDQSKSFVVYSTTKVFGPITINS